MNVRLITKALHTLSLLSDEDYDLVLKLRALTEDEREQFRTALELQKPAGKKATAITERKIEHCVACDYTKRALVHKDPNADGYHEFQSARGEKKSSKSSSSKSPRATGIEQQLNKRRRGTTVISDDDGDSYCTHQYEHDGMMVECGEPADQNIHHLRSVEGYHPFVSESHVPTAPTRSPANGGASNSIPSSEASAASAHAATGGSSE